MAAAKRRTLRAEALGASERLGYSVAVDDGEGLRSMRDEAASNLVGLRRMVRRLGFHIGEDGIAVATSHPSGRPTGEARTHALVQIYNEERDRLAKLDKICIDAGLAARAQQLNEDQGRILAKVMQATFVEIGLTLEQQTVAKQVLAAKIRDHARVEELGQ